MADEEKGELSSPRDRSPAFPYIALDVSVDRVKRIFQGVRDLPQPRELLAQAYGKPATSSGTLQTFATLLQYGLLENVVTPTGRKMKVSRLAQEILNPHAPQEKIHQSLQTAALKPTIFAELWSLYGDLSQYSEKVPLYYLTTERGTVNSGGTFNDKAALDVLRVYRATLAYAGISGSANNQSLAKEDADTLPLTAKVGDLVQVEINGAFQFKQPKRVDEIKLHDGKHWAFLEGEKSGIEMSQVIVQQTGDLTPIVRNAPPQRELDLPSSEGGLLLDWSEETLIDDGGDEIKIRYKGKASRERYEFIRDYLDFKIQRLTKKPN